MVSLILFNQKPTYGMALTPLTIVNILIIFILVLFTIMLFHVGKHTLSNKYLGFYFISQILVLGSIVAGDIQPPVLESFLISIEYSWGAFFYLFVCALLDNKFVFRSWYLWYFALTPPIFIILLLNHDTRFSELINNYLPGFAKRSNAILGTIFNIAIVGFNIAALVKYSKFRKKLKTESRLVFNVPPLWINMAIWGFVVACALVQLGIFLNKSVPSTTVNWQIIGNTAFLVYFCVLFYVAVISRTLTEQFLTREKYKNSNLNQTESEKLLARIEELMKVQKPFVNQEFKLKDLAEMLQTSERNISQTVNEFKQQNVPDYINSFRLNYAMGLLSDENLKEKTILWVLFEAGFNSKATFNTLFKKTVGCTPAEYRKNQLP